MMDIKNNARNQQRLADNCDMPPGIYLCKFYAYNLKFPNGKVYKTNWGVRCTENACGGWRNVIKVKNGNAYMLDELIWDDSIDMYNYEQVYKKYANKYNFTKVVTSNFSALTKRLLSLEDTICL